MAHLAPDTSGSSRTHRAVAIIPARLDSTRLARKMLLRDTGRFLFEHTVANLLEGGALERVVLATDSEEILAAAKDTGVEALMTRADHKSGTDRVHEAHRQLVERGEAFDVVVNVQGDEPDVDSGDLRRLIAAFEDSEVELATLWASFEDASQVDAGSAVKLVTDARGDALYFSRAAIPDRSHARAEASDSADSWKRHIGVYAFRPDALARFCALPAGRLERLENLEQLRWLEAGHRLRAIRADHCPSGIDTAEDYAAFVARTAHPRPTPGLNS